MEYIKVWRGERLEIPLCIGENRAEDYIREASPGKCQACGAPLPEWIPERGREGEQCPYKYCSKECADVGEYGEYI